HERVGALRELGVGRQRLAAHLLDEPLRAAGAGIGRVDGLSPPSGERARHVAAADEAEHSRRRLFARRQDWLKKPFSMSRARSSADISTLRGVSMNTLSAIRCMPPSSAYVSPEAKSIRRLARSVSEPWRLRITGIESLNLSAICWASLNDLGTTRCTRTSPLPRLPTGLSTVVERPRAPRPPAAAGSSSLKMSSNSSRRRRRR